jgi:predicted Rossmann-fold nucleotide-binding protein
VGSDYWSGLIDWLEDQVLRRGLVSKEDLKLFHLVDTAEEVAEIVRDEWLRLRGEEARNAGSIASPPTDIP